LVSVTLICLTDNPEHSIALGLLGWQKVAHASRRVHVFSHGSSLDCDLADGLNTPSADIMSMGMHIGGNKWEQRISLDK
jgi:hypothetical protein